MKQVIREKQDLKVISIDETSADKVYVATSRLMIDEDKDRYWLLTYVKGNYRIGSYIFLDIKSSQLGHSGDSDTVQGAIKKALIDKTTKVFEFDNTFEAALFIATAK